MICSQLIYQAFQAKFKPIVLSHTLLPAGLEKEIIMTTVCLGENHLPAFRFQPHTARKVQLILRKQSICVVICLTFSEQIISSPGGQTVYPLDRPLTSHHESNQFKFIGRHGRIGCLVAGNGGIDINLQFFFIYIHLDIFSCWSSGYSSQLISQLHSVKFPQI